MSEADYERITLPEFVAMSERWNEEQRRLDYRAAIAAGFIHKSDKESFSIGELFPSLKTKEDIEEENAQAGIEAFKAFMGYPVDEHDIQ